jgi:hypothetical protein
MRRTAKNSSEPIFILGGLKVDLIKRIVTL